MKRALCLGGAGFIAGHLTKYLKSRDYEVISADIKHPEFGPTGADKHVIVDLRVTDVVKHLVETHGPFDDVFQLGAAMGGMLFISSHHSEILHSNALINLNVIEAVKEMKCRYFYSSSACSYPEYKQDGLDSPPLKESDAWQGMPQDAYGVEKLFSESLSYYYKLDYGLDTHVARFHNTYGPYGTWHGGREKAPAALCRKIAEAKLGGFREIEVIGDGLAQRTYLYVSDLVDGIYRLTQSDHPGPMNLGSTEQVTVDDLAYLISDIAQWEIEIKHVPGPQGVRSRNSDNSLAEQVLGWKPKVSLREGLEMTYPWVEEQVRKVRR